MDELALLRQLRTDLDRASTGPDSAALLRARQRLLAEIDSPAADGTPLPPSPDVAPVHPRAHRDRWAPSARWAPVLAVAAVVAILTVLAVGAGVVHRSRTTAPATSSYAGDPVPWSDAGGKPTIMPVPESTVVNAPAGTRACTDKDFSLVSSSSKPGPGGDAAWMVTTYTLIAVAATPCTTQGASAVLVDSNGEKLPFDGLSPQGPPDFSAPLVTAGSFLTGTINWAVVRGATNPPTALDLFASYDLRNPRSRSSLSISVAGLVIPPHPTNPSSPPLGPWRSSVYGDRARVSVAGSLASLGVTLQVGTSVRLGEKLSYTVTLSNPTGVAVSLASCPGFVEVLSVVPQKQPTSVGRQGPLNCADVPRSIGPGKTLTLQMKLTTDGLIAVPGFLTWQLTSNGVAVSTSRTQIAVLP